MVELGFEYTFWTRGDDQLRVRNSGGFQGPRVKDVAISVDFSEHRHVWYRLTSAFREESESENGSQISVLVFRRNPKKLHFTVLPLSLEGQHVCLGHEIRG